VVLQVPSAVATSGIGVCDKRHRRLQQATSAAATSSGCGNGFCIGVSGCYNWLRRQLLLAPTAAAIAAGGCYNLLRWLLQFPPVAAAIGSGSCYNCRRRLLQFDVAAATICCGGCHNWIQRLLLLVLAAVGVCYIPAGDATRRPVAG
jgi:hypothetical protein